jgi:pyruvyltransferase
MLLVDNKVPMRYWNNAINMGDLLGPWLVEKMTGKKTVWVEKDEPHYMVIGSILGRVSPSTICWGVGSFGTETAGGIKSEPHYLAVRGPLTRARIVSESIPCPRIYGDPALLVPDYFAPKVIKEYEIGVIMRWSEHRRKENFEIPGALLIDMLSDDIEGVITQMLSCKKIIASSLHGLILADAYGIPNAWLAAETGKGREYKFFDYFASVNKLRTPSVFKIDAPGVTLNDLEENFEFDGREIEIDLDRLRSTNPFTNVNEDVLKAERIAVENAVILRQITERRTKLKKSLAFKVANRLNRSLQKITNRILS